MRMRFLIGVLSMIWAVTSVSALADGILLQGVHFDQGEIFSYHPKCPEDGCAITTSQGNLHGVQFDEAGDELRIEANVDHYQTFLQGAAFENIVSVQLSLKVASWQQALRAGTLDQYPSPTATGRIALDTPSALILRNVSCDLSPGSKVYATDQGRHISCTVADTDSDMGDMPILTFGFLKNN